MQLRLNSGRLIPFYVDRRKWKSIYGGRRLGRRRGAPPHDPHGQREDQERGGRSIPVGGRKQHAVLRREGALRLGPLEQRLAAEFSVEEVMRAMKLGVRKICGAAEGRPPERRVCFKDGE